jgi:hypothetical protein
MSVSPAGASGGSYPWPSPATLPPSTVARAQPTGGAQASAVASPEAENTPSGGRVSAEQPLTEQERQQLQALQKRDREVRAHEMAHVAAGAGLVTRGASYTYQSGPDGQRYAIGGEVSIDTSPGRTPEETLDKAARIRAAALAPADPSPQDRRVAAQAGRMTMDARMELARQQFEAQSKTNADAPNNTTADKGATAAGAADTPAVSAWRASQAQAAYRAASTEPAPGTPTLNLTA